MMSNILPLYMIVALDGLFEVIKIRLLKEKNNIILDVKTIGSQ